MNAHNKVDPTGVPSLTKPMLVWDGTCGFCKYWITRWHKITGQEVDYAPYQKVGNAFPQVDTSQFQEAVHLFEADGVVLRGAAAVTKTLTYGRGKWTFLHTWYQGNPLFRGMCDHLYTWIARHRNPLFKATKLMWGPNPDRMKPYWLGYVILGGLIWSLLSVMPQYYPG